MEFIAWAVTAANNDSISSFLSGILLSLYQWFILAFDFSYYHEQVAFLLLIPLSMSWITPPINAESLFTTKVLVGQKCIWLWIRTSTTTWETLVLVGITNADFIL